MNITAALLFFCYLAIPCVAFGKDSLCKQGEIVFFSCKVKDSQKTISICGNRQMGVDTAIPVTSEDWIQYRFGTSQNVEMVYPAKKAGALEKFSYLFQNSNQNYIEELSFQILTYSYTVFKIMPREVKESYGVRIERKGKIGSLANYFCSVAPSGSFVGLANVLSEK